MTAWSEHAEVREADTTTDAHHVVYLRVKTCDAPKCNDRAHRWMRCGRCQKLISRCGAHDHKLVDEVRAHCPK